MEEQIFKNKKNTVLGKLISIIVSIIVLVSVFFISKKILANRFGLNEDQIILISAGFGILLFLIYIYRAFNHPDYVLTSQNLIVRKGKKDRKVYLLDECTFSSNIIDHYYNGIKTGTTRELIINNGKKQKIINTRLSKTLFTNLVSLLISRKRLGDALNSFEKIEDSINEQLKNPKIYSIDKSKVLKKSITSSLIFLFIGLITCFFLVKYLNQNGVIYSLVIVGVILCIAIYTLLQNIFYLRKMPNEIIVNKEAITIDNTCYNFSEINEITMTPYSYSREGGKTRKLEIIHQNNTTKNYILGYRSKNAKGDYIFKEYEELFLLLQDIFAHQPNKFKLNL